MDERYKQLEMAGVSNIMEYNAKYKSGNLSKEKGHNLMPYVVIVVDEYGDLMITNGKKAETPIVQLASTGFKVGIHLIISTQRTSYNVITGFISANFPTRIAFRVATAYESRRLINDPDATELMGNGDMFFMSPDEKIHAQGAFVE